MSATVFYSDVNEIATLSNVFSSSGVPGDPTTVTCTVTDPTGAAVIYTVTAGQITRTTPAGVPTYVLNVPSSLDGIWAFKWSGTGTIQDVSEGTWTSLTISQLYCTVEELKSRLNITDASDDFEVTLAVQAACRSIDEITGRYFWRGADTRTYVPQSVYRQEIDDLVSVTSLKIDRDGDGVFEETWVQDTDYRLEVSPGKYNTASRGELWPFTGFVILGPKYIPLVWPWSHQDRIQVSAVFGWPAVPATVKQASLIAAADLFKIKDAPFGIAGFGEFGAVRVKSNPRVMSLLHRYISGDQVGV